MYKLAVDTWGKEEYQAIQDVIASNQFSMSTKVSEFEIASAKKFNSNYSVMVNSGSSANLLMIAALFYKKENPLKRGDEVIVPAVSWSTTYAPLQQFGLKVKFIDIDIKTLNFNLDDLKSAISENTRAILCVNLLGNPNNFDIINSLIEDKDICLLEDNCESMGSSFSGKNSGTFGLMGTFSTFYSHHISTMEGGFVLTDDQELYEIMLCLRAHGWTRNLPDKNHVTGTKSKDWFEESFKFVLPGFNLRPLELSGAIGVKQLEKLDNFVEIRRKNAILFKDVVSNFDWIDTQLEIGNSSWFGFSLILNSKCKVTRSYVLEVLSESNIEFRPIVTGNFTKNKSLLEYFNYEIPFPLTNSENLENNGFFIGNSHIDLSKEMNFLKIALRSIADTF